MRRNARGKVVRYAQANAPYRYSEMKIAVVIFSQMSNQKELIILLDNSIVF